VARGRRGATAFLNRLLGRTASSTLEVRRDAAYRAWLQRHTPASAELTRLAAEAARFASLPLISIITPVYNTRPEWLRACIASVIDQTYSNWQLCLCDDGSSSAETIAVLNEQRDARITVTRLERNAGICGASNRALASARGEFIALLDHDDELTPDALQEVVRCLNAAPDTDIVYSDEDKRDADGGLSEPFFKPDWCPEHLLSAMYTCHLTVMRRTVAEAVGGFREGFEGAQDHDLMLRASERTDAVAHVPRILYHWRRTPEATATAGAAKPWADVSGRRAVADAVRRRRIDAEVVSGGVPGLYRVKFAVQGDPLVAIVVVDTTLERGRIDQAVQRLRAATRYPRYEVHDVQAPQTSVGASVNALVRASRADHVVVFDASLQPMEPEWLDALIEYSQQSAIGAVGAKVIYHDGRLRHVGLLTGMTGGPARALHGQPGSSFGYFSSAIGVRNYSAVSSDCLMTRRAVFDALEGFDPRLPWSVADVDYCLRARRLGHRVVFTPYARLETWTRTPKMASVDAAAATTLESKWGSDLARDPCYNPNLSRADPDYLPGS